MTQLDLIYLASIVGAVLFFAAGAAAVALRRSERAVPMARVAPAAPVALVAPVAPPTPRPDPELRVLRERAERAEAHAERLVRDLDLARAEAVTTVRDTDGHEARTRELERELAERVAAMRDLSTENELLKGRIRDAEALRSDYVRLRTSATDAEFLRREVVRLEGELRTFHIEALGPARPRRDRSTSRRMKSPRATVGESLATAIDRFADDGTRSIAVADTMGFPLASQGADASSLAAYAALLVESATRARQFLPVTGPIAIEVVDERGTRVSVWTFDVEADRLLLAHLAVTPVDARRLETTLADLSAILQPKALPSYT